MTGVECRYCFIKLNRQLVMHTRFASTYDLHSTQVTMDMKILVVNLSWCLHSGCVCLFSAVSDVMLGGTKEGHGRNM